jgi:hypothetical protein
VNGSVNNGAASPFAQMAAFGNNRRGQRSLYNGGVGVQLGNSAWDARPFSFGGARASKPSYDDAQVLATFGGPLAFSAGFAMHPMYSLAISAWWITRRRRNQRLCRPSSNDAATSRTQSTPWPSDSAHRSGQQASILEWRDSERPAQSAAQSLLQYYPTANLDAGGRYNYQTPVVVVPSGQCAGACHAFDQRPQPALWQHVVSAVDHRRWQSVWLHRLDASLNVRYGDQLVTPVLAVSVGAIRYQYTRQSTDVTPFFAGRTNVSGDAGIAGNNQEAANWGPPALTFASGLAGLSSAQFAANDTSTHAGGIEISKRFRVTPSRLALTFGRNTSTWCRSRMPAARLALPAP